MPLLTTYIEKFQDIRVLVIGDIMLDRFMYGKVERISPEAPVPVFKFHHEKKNARRSGKRSGKSYIVGRTLRFHRDYWQR